MKLTKLIYAGMLSLALSAVASAVPVVWQSTSTASNTGFRGVPLCATNRHAILHGICTDFGVAAASMTIVTSSYTINFSTFAMPSSYPLLNGGTQQFLLGPVTLLVADQCKYYDVAFPSGMGYVKPNAAGATIMYMCY